MSRLILILALMVLPLGYFVNTGTAQVLGDTVQIPYCMTQEEVRMVRAVNDLRVEHDLPRLTAVVPLGAAARGHSMDMRDLVWTNDRGREQVGYFEHVSPNGGTLRNRVAAQGYSGNYVGENILWGETNPRRAVDIFAGSSGHLQNMLNPRFTAIGVGFAPGPGPDGNNPSNLWTQNFGDQVEGVEVAQPCDTQPITPTPTVVPPTPTPTSVPTTPEPITPTATIVPPTNTPVVTPTEIVETPVPSTPTPETPTPVVPTPVDTGSKDVICTGTQESDGTLRIVCIPAPQLNN